MSTEVIIVRCWGRDVGAVAADRATRSYVFSYYPAWRRDGIELAPLQMPVDTRQRDATRRWVFPDLSPQTYHRLPALLSDALPGAFGNALIDAWVARRGTQASAITSLDRLAWVGSRGMGALEFESADSSLAAGPPNALDVGELAEAARRLIAGPPDDVPTSSQLNALVQVGTSAGGLRPKAVVAWNPVTDELRAGHADAPPGFEHWLLKFDGVWPERHFGASGRIEYAYYLMAREAGLDMMECRLLEEGGRAHFMTRRFDREDGRKHHVQSLCAIDHLDYCMPGVHGYEQYLGAIRRLGLGQEALDEAFRRMAFNIVARNCDDHTKNFAFILRQEQQWGLAPAYDVTFAHGPRHRMSVGGGFKGIDRQAVLTLGVAFGVRDARKILNRVVEVVHEWPTFAARAGVSAPAAAQIAAFHEYI